MALAASITTDMSISYVCACVRACGQGDGCYVCAANAAVSCVCVGGGVHQACSDRNVPL
jgi:hypothetical protein